MSYENHTDLTNGELEFLIGEEILLLNKAEIVPMIIEKGGYVPRNKKYIVKFLGNRTFQFPQMFPNIKTKAA